jgi:hypothetical protein
MENNRTERAVGHLLGTVGGLLIAVGGLLAASFGIADLVLGRMFGAAAGLGAAVVLFVLGGLVLLFAHMGSHEWKDRPLTSGVLLVVLGVVSWAVMGLGTNVLALVGGLLALVAGVLYLVEPTEQAASALAAHA